MSRYGNNKISRDKSFSTYAVEDPSWAADYLEAVNKYSVKSRKDDSELFNQINQIVGNKSKFSSVEEAVLDMQKRTGLLEFLNKKASEESKSLLETHPDLKEFIESKVDAFPGSAVDAIADMILQEEKYKNALKSGEHIPKDVKEFINKVKKEKYKEQDKTSDGKIDLDFNSKNDNDPFKFLTPTSF